LGFQFILFDRSVLVYSTFGKILNGVVLLLVGVYAFLLISPRKSWFKYTRLILFISILVLTVGFTMMGNIFDIPGVNQYLYHDGAALSDLAYEKVIEGKNPYSVSYRGTSFDQYYGQLVYNEAGNTLDNPALEQYIYLPATFLINGFINSFEYWIFGFSDARILVLLSFIGIIVLLWYLLRDSNYKYIILTLFALNPIYLLSFFEGRNDILVIFYLLAFIFAFNKQKYLLAGILFGLALASKQFAWLVLPLVIIYLFYSSSRKFINKNKNIKTFIYSTAIVALVFMLPFLIWSPVDFIKDTVLYPGGGGTATPYPIAGYGLSPLSSILDNDITGSYPFGIIALVIVIVLYYFFWKRLKDNPSWWLIVLLSSLMIFFTSLVSRAMNDNYVAFISQLLIISFVFLLVESKKEV